MFDKTTIVQTLASIPFFLDLNPLSLQRLAEIAELRQVNNGDVIFLEGDRVTDLFILLEGQITLHCHVPNLGNVSIFTAEPLDIFGWSSMTPIVRQRTASAIAIRDCMVVRFNAEELRALCDRDHDIGYFIMRRTANIVASRLLATRLQLYDVIVHQTLLHPVHE